MKRKYFKDIKNYFKNIIKSLSTFYILLKNERVFNYFIGILALMAVSAALFFFVEYDNVANAFPTKDHLTIIDKITTVLYWAVVTISTVGYGDITPTTTLGRILVSIIMYSSIAAVSLFTANLASALTTKKLMERRGFMDLSEYNEHFIICGWKRDMYRVLNEIAHNNPKLPLKKIIIIANIESDTIELFRQQHPKFKSINIIRGDHYNETLLKKANILNAARVLILADESQNSTTTEMDSKTVMTAMTINSISINIKVTAELLNIKFEKYLKTTHVEEIIYTNEYSRSLIANSLTHTGITKVLNELLSMNTENFLTTAEIPEKYIGKEYQEIQKYFHDKNSSLVIGLIENVGSYLERKKEAIREAQKTADVKRLITNLKTAKKIENHLPNINPPANYIIPRHSRIILIEKREVA